jgi:integrase
MRAVVGTRDATALSVLAYAGLRPGELRVLRWGNVQPRTLIVNAAKTRTRRSVRLLASLADDLATWRLASGRPADDSYVFPAVGGASGRPTPSRSGDGGYSSRRHERRRSRERVRTICGTISPRSFSMRDVA